MSRHASFNRAEDKSGLGTNHGTAALRTTQQLAGWCKDGLAQYQKRWHLTAAWAGHVLSSKDSATHYTDKGVLTGWKTSGAGQQLVTRNGALMVSVSAHRHYTVLHVILELHPAVECNLNLLKYHTCNHVANVPGHQLRANQSVLYITLLRRANYSMVVCPQA